MGYQIGIDVGGTFTDLLVCDDDGSTRICKFSWEAWATNEELIEP